MIQITPVGGAPGGEAWLLQTEQKSALVDSGFAFSAPQMVANLERALAGRPLDLVILTHTHYDHASGSVYVKERWPEAQVIAGTYAAHVFTRPGARQTIYRMNRAAAAEHGVQWDDPGMPDRLRVDRAVAEGDVIDLGDLSFTVYETPGHTRCTCAFYCESERFLIGNETIGLPALVGDMVVPSFLVSYEDSVMSVRKLMKLRIDRILFPHVGMLEGQSVRGFFPQALVWFEKTKDAVVGAYLSGLRGDDLIAILTDQFYHEEAARLQPKAAFMLNASYMIPMLVRECLGIEGFDLPHEIAE